LQVQIVADSKRVKVLCFGPFRLETPNGMLLLNDRPVQIPPRALAVLRLLVATNGGLVTKEDLIEKVWSGAFIEESNITKSIADSPDSSPWFQAGRSHSYDLETGLSLCRSRYQRGR